MGFGGLGFGELVLIFAVLLLLFGAKRLPELASGMGKGIRDFKRSLNGLRRPVDPGAADASVALPGADSGTAHRGTAAGGSGAEAAAGLSPLASTC
jgi:sec-independent protein translocase protein TatA